MNDPTTVPGLPTIEELMSDPAYYVHHSAHRKGYESRRGNGHVERYAGKFGKGFVLVTPNWDSTRYVNITYYIEVKKETKRKKKKKNKVKLLKGIKERAYLSLERGDYEPDGVNVFCRLETRADNLADLNETAKAVSRAYPGIKPGQMYPHRLGPHETSRGAGMMTVMVNIPTEEVRQNLAAYACM